MQISKTIFKEQATNYFWAVKLRIYDVKENKLMVFINSNGESVYIRKFFNNFIRRDKSISKALRKWIATGLIKTTNNSSAIGELLLKKTMNILETRMTIVLLPYANHIICIKQGFYKTYLWKHLGLNNVNNSLLINLARSNYTYLTIFNIFNKHNLCLNKIVNFINWLLVLI